ncbi:hypothetical protein C1645_753531 [Glomus cerebriforme]|uniref:BTB domain-containing protein n=1 Tax=Glomus cerebriforme TaxID=658196 RepID=A0A397TJ68_9GLOM|nr:hypothetical protein C1645_753531 [Glomus cerebriforme]
MDLTIGLLRDIGKLYYEADDYNVYITVGGADEGIEIETFKAHSVILRSRSTYFQNVLSNNNDEIKKDGEIFLLKFPTIHPDVFRLLLKYIYTGICNLKELDMHIMYVPLLLAADELSLLDLVKYIQSHLIANEQSWLHENIIHIFQISSHSTTFSLLSNHCCELICEIPSLLFSTSSFTRLEKFSLLMIIKRDDLNLDEIDIWQYLLQWAINQDPFLNSSDDIYDTSSWTKKDFIELENRLKDFLPFIRFFQIPGDQLYEFIWPFKKILPKQLKSQLTKLHMTQNSELPSFGSSFNLSLRIPRYKIDSLYISPRNAGILNSWIKTSSKSELRKRDETEFKLLLRGSRDGMDVKTFHKLCDNKGPTLILVKVLESNNDDDDDDSNHTINKRHTTGNIFENRILRNNENGNSKVRRFSTSVIDNNNTNTDNSTVIGGYNPLSWSSSDKYKQTTDSFIFSFKNPLKCESNEYVLSRIQNDRYAIRDMSCKFNNIGFGHDLWWFSGSCTQQYYEKRIIPTTHANTFVMEDYEVFQVIHSSEKDKESFGEEEILEENESIIGSEVKSELKGEMKSVTSELNNDKLYNMKNISVNTSINERDDSVLNVGGGDNKSDDSFSEVIIL